MTINESSAEAYLKNDNAPSLVMKPVLNRKTQSLPETKATTMSFESASEANNSSTEYFHEHQSIEIMDMNRSEYWDKYKSIQ